MWFSILCCTYKYLVHQCCISKIQTFVYAMTVGNIKQVKTCFHIYSGYGVHPYRIIVRKVSLCWATGRWDHLPACFLNAAWVSRWRAANSGTWSARTWRFRGLVSWSDGTDCCHTWRIGECPNDFAYLGVVESFPVGEDVAKLDSSFQTAAGRKQAGASRSNHSLMQFSQSVDTGCPQRYRPSTEGLQRLLWGTAPRSHPLLLQNAIWTGRSFWPARDQHPVFML